MSFEGFYQMLCENGHSMHEDVYGFDEPENKLCSICGKKVAWWNLVDTTNGSWDDDGKRIDGYVKLKQDEPEKTCTCPNCGNNHVVKQQTYKIPKSRGHRIKT